VIEARDSPGGLASGFIRDGCQLAGIGLILVGIRRWGRERDRRERMLRERTFELERQTERLQNFASVVTHDLRNPLQVAMINLDIARNEHDTERLAKIEGTLDRMGEGAIEEGTVDIEIVVEAAWDSVESEDARLVVGAEGLIRADAAHLQHAFENLSRNALEHGGPGVTVTVGALGIVEAHGWTISVVESADGGARFEITGVESAEQS
jgi:signal transduction histidine kinase